MNAQGSGLSAASEAGQDDLNAVYNLSEERYTETASGVKTLTEDEALSQCVVFFVGGLDTMSTVLACTAYLLALHPEVQYKLREEVNHCFKQHGPEPSADVVSKMKYLHCVISESMRLYPPGVRIDRTAAVDYVLGETGIHVPKGSIVGIPVYAMHHDPLFFDDPEKFNPERFSDENVHNIQPYSYLPFGAGPRNCIGMRFALQTVKLCLLHALHNVEFIRTPKTQVPPDISKTVGVLSVKEIIVGVRKLS